MLRHKSLTGFSVMIFKALIMMISIYLFRWVQNSHNDEPLNHFFFTLCNNTTWKVSVFGVFLVRIFPHSDWIQRAEFSGPYFPAFSPNAEKYGPEKLRIRILFTQCNFIQYYTQMKRLQQMHNSKRFSSKTQCLQVGYHCLSSYFILPYKQRLWLSVISMSSLNMFVP